MDDFSTPTNISWRGDVGVVEYGGGDKGMICMFYNRPMHDPIKSKEAGSICVPVTRFPVKSALPRKGSATLPCSRWRRSIMSHPRWPVTRSSSTT